MQQKIAAARQAAARSQQTLRTYTWLDDPSNAVTLRVSMQALPDGTSYPASTTLSIPGRQVEVQITNSNYQKVAP